MRLAYAFTIVSCSLAACSVIDTTVGEGGPNEDASSDALGAVDAAATCAPGPVDASAFSFVPPSTPNPNACTTSQVGALYDACFAIHASLSACQAFAADPTNATCYACMISDQRDASTYGALVSSGGVDNANVPGCIALVTQDTSATGCAAETQKQMDCEIAACLGGCPTVGDLASFEEYSRCVAAADTTVCASEVSSAKSTCTADGGPDAASLAECESYASFADFYNAMAARFCE